VTPQLDTETNGSGTTIRDYLYGNQLISMTTGGGSPATYYYSFDALGSVADLTNSSGTTEITYSYDAWGNPTATPISGAPTNPIQYTAAYNDPTGLTHLGARQYDPTTGRFLQTDPANLATGSTYAYADNEPTAATDPSGLGSQGTFGVVNLSWIAGAFDAASDGYYSVRDARRALLEWETRHPGFLTGVQIAAFVGTGGDAADVDLPTPVVENPRLQNVVNDLYKGVSNPDRVGNGTTADAVRSEAETGQPTGGTFHTQKAQQYSNALTKLLSGGTLNPRDRIVAQSLLDDLQAALGNRP